MDPASPAETSEGNDPLEEGSVVNSEAASTEATTEAAAEEPGRRNSISQGNGRRNSVNEARRNSVNGNGALRDVGNAPPTGVSDRTFNRRNSGDATPRDVSEQSSSWRNSESATQREPSSSRRNSENAMSREQSSTRRNSESVTSREHSRRNSESATPRDVSEQNSSWRTSESTTPRDASERRNSGSAPPRDAPEQNGRRYSGNTTVSEQNGRRNSLNPSQEITASASGDSTAHTLRRNSFNQTPGGEANAAGPQGAEQAPLSERNGRRSSISQLLDRVNGRRPSQDVRNDDSPGSAFTSATGTAENSGTASPVVLAEQSIQRRLSQDRQDDISLAAPPLQPAEQTIQRRLSQDKRDDVSQAASPAEQNIQRRLSQDKRDDIPPDIPPDASPVVPAEQTVQRRLSQDRRDDIAHATALVSDLVNRVSASNDLINEKAAESRPAAPPERRESLRRTSASTDNTPSSPIKIGEKLERRLSTGGAESSGRQSQKKRGSTIESSKDSSDVDSGVDEVEREYIQDVMRRRSSMKEEEKTREEQMRREAVEELSSTADVPDIHARLLSLKLAVQDYELPMRLAYDELDELAANAARVQRAIEKNMNLLTIQLKRSCMRYLRSAFRAWIFYWNRKKGRRLAARNATDYFQRRVLARAFQAWRIFYLRMQKFRRLQHSAEKLLRRHYLARIWRAWRTLVKKRIREDERHRREKQLVREISVKQRESTGRRAVNAMRRRKLQRVFSVFKMGVAISREIDSGRDHIFYMLLRRKAALVFKFWKTHRARRARNTRAIVRRETKILRACFWCWEDQTGFARYRKRRMAKRRLANAFGLWILFVCQKARYDTIVMRVTRERLRRYFDDLHAGCVEEKWRKRNCGRVQKRCASIRLKYSFQGWIWYMQLQAHKRMLKLEDYVALLEKESQRTRTECDRLARIIDTGEWDQPRALELEQASQVLSSERDALTKLVGRLEREHACALEHQNQQEQEIQMLKEQMLGSNFVHRNKLVVRGASSFNSVVRAVKSEVLKQGVNPEVVYSIDRMAMNQVSVFPDGDLHVKPLNKFDKGKWMHRSSTDTTKAFMEEPPKLIHR